MLYYDLTAGPPTLDLGTIDLEPAKVTRLYGRPMPELPSGAIWRGTPPVTFEQMRGHVVLIHFCQHAAGVCVPGAVPQWAANYRSRGLIVFAVHKPDLEERDVPSHASYPGGTPLPTMIDVRGSDSFVSRLGVTQCMLLVDDQGKLIRRFSGYNPGDVLPELEAALARANR